MKDREKRVQGILSPLYLIHLVSLKMGDFTARNGDSPQYFSGGKNG